MGSARHRSWSHTRQHTYDGCPRALYFAYYPWGDPDQNLARFLRRVTSPEGLAGTIVHKMIVIGLRTLVRRGSYPTNLAATGLAQYEDAIERSLAAAKLVRAGKRPPDEGSCLFHNLYGAEDQCAEEKGRGTVRESLDAFEQSTALTFLKSTNFDRWQRILTNTDDVPSYYTTAALGFTTSIGLRVYAAYDLALWHGDEFLVVDWKTGSPSGPHILASRQQLSVYALWAMSTGVPLERVSRPGILAASWRRMGTDRADRTGHRCGDCQDRGVGQD